MPIITLTTDFGTGSHYVAQLKGVLLTGAPSATLIDLSHDIPPQGIAAAARLLELGTPRFPAGTVHLAVVDPGVGTERAIVAVRVGGHHYVGPDNGLFGWLNGWIDGAVALDLERLSVEAASATFHGRDIMAPVAARLARGERLAALGDAVEELVCLPAVPTPLARPGRIEGQIVEVDTFGNLISNIPLGMLSRAPRNNRLCVSLGEHETYGLQTTYADQDPQTLVALVGSGGMLELAIVNGNAAQMIAAGEGDMLVVSWCPT
ncbi:SAM hydrolase/SAM-dependent halogenase family protein [Botrimarina hoheduenensis]|uniref:Adenosyl-chloride synthase n=1 Tax=Botrimarina hoheduenensis TaxID=2528000 RepID=A0A5C5VYA1_9BACT|nr:SAM-dependent chlorinase/fluorinase [Botrimarina hoheduenensis]TWT42923.1 Adenosyl-chloride synthase [Botrimarina hoheduenensis]